MITFTGTYPSSPKTLASRKPTKVDLTWGTWIGCRCKMMSFLKQVTGTLFLVYWHILAILSKMFDCDRLSYSVRITDASCFKISSKFLQDSPKSSWYNPSVFVPAGVTFYILWSQVPVGGLWCDALLVRDDWMVGVGCLWWFFDGILPTFRLWLKPDFCCFIGRSGRLGSTDVVAKKSTDMRFQQVLLHAVIFADGLCLVMIDNRYTL